MFSNQEQIIINQAIQVIESKRLTSVYLCSTEIAKHHAILTNAQYANEVFSVFFLNSQHQLIAREEFGTGTIDACNVYPRSVAKRALELNSANVILSHNHPSGCLTPSDSDVEITNTIRSCLAFFKIGVLDHIITANGKAISMSELGII